MTTIVCVANEKGGVAKTTTTVSLAAALVETGLEVLVIDLDGQANLSLALGAEQSHTAAGAAQILLDGAPARAAVQNTGIPRLDLIPSSQQINQAEQTLSAQPGYEMTLARAFRTADWSYDFVLIDCPPFLGAVTINALMASHLLLMPTQAEFFSINALRNMMATIRSVRVQGNPRLTYRLLLTMYDRRNRIHRTLGEQMRATFGSGVFESMIEIDTKLRESAIAGLPILYHAPKSRAAVQYRALAQETIAYVKETSSAPA
jgi:chromosome partitioning protein